MRTPARSRFSANTTSPGPCGPSSGAHSGRLPDGEWNRLLDRGKKTREKLAEKMIRQSARRRRPPRGNSRTLTTLGEANRLTPASPATLRERGPRAGRGRSQDQYCRPRLQHPGPVSEGAAIAAVTAPILSELGALHRRRMPRRTPTSAKSWATAPGRTPASSSWFAQTNGPYLRGHQFRARPRLR